MPRETCVLIELERRGAEIAYVRTEEGHEVDFLVRHRDNHEELIQVCVDMSDAVTRRREIGSLQKAAKEHPRATLHVVSLEPETPADVPPEITVHPASRWLLREGEA